MAEEDIIFGKNRHFFGGLEPSNMTDFTVTVENGEVKINAQLPAHTVVDGQTLCTVAGAVIRRDPSDYPKDEFAGELVANITASTSFVDPTADPTGSYYYRAFPYTTKGVYNRNSVSKAAINEPEPMVAFSAKSVYDASTDTASVQLTVDMPDSAVGVVIRKSSMGYPVNETDGEEVMTVTSDGVYTDSDNIIAGLTYYYTAFPYTSNGGYNRSETNRASIGVTKYEYLFGYDLDTNDSDPTTRVTYPSDVDNYGYTAAYMDFSAGTFNYGSWNITPGEKFMPKPCMLTYGGVVDYYLNTDNYWQQEDGTTSDASSSNYEGNAMMEWPKIYTKRWEDENGIYHFRCCDIKLDDDYECWCNYDINNNEIDHFYTAIYTGVVLSSKLRSNSGVTITVSNTAANEIKYAKANGDDWYTEVLSDHLLIQDLLVMMAKSTDCQTAYGNGACNNTAAIKTGTMNTNGMFWGSNDQTSGVKVFGMENYWGNINRRIAGWINDNGVQKVKLTRGTHDGSTVTDYNTDGSGYLTVANTTPSGTSGGYISEMKTEAYGRIPVVASGSATIYEADGMWFTNSSADKYYAYISGPYNAGTMNGPFFVSLNYGTSAASSIGAALSCKPSAT